SSSRSVVPSSSRRKEGSKCQPARWTCERAERIASAIRGSASSPSRKGSTRQPERGANEAVLAQPPAAGGSIASPLPRRRSRRTWRARTIRSSVSPTRSSRRLRGYGATGRLCPGPSRFSPRRRGVLRVRVRAVAVDGRAGEGGNREILDRQVRDRRPHEVAPDLRRQRAAGYRPDILDVQQRDLASRITHPDTRHQLRHVAAEPRVLEV